MASILNAPVAFDMGGEVSSVAGTANQVLVNGGTAAQTGAVTLSLPEAIIVTNSSSSRLVLSKNPSGYNDLSASGGTLLSLTGNDGAVCDFIMETYDNANSSARLFFRRAMGTFLVPLALTSGRTIFSLLGRGYTGAAFSGTRSEIRVETTENWSSTANGTRMVLTTTPNGSTTNTSALFINPDQSIQPVGGIVGTSTNNNAATGIVGEVLSATIASGSAVSLSTGATSNVTSVSLTAGDWDVMGVVDFILGAATATNFKYGSSSTSATLGAQDTFGQIPLITTLISDTYAAGIPTTRISLAATTTIYLVAQATFAAGTITAYGTIWARRRR